MVDLVGVLEGDDLRRLARIEPQLECCEPRVVDSTADMRYIVIPRRPPGTEELDEDALAGIVTRDSMIGVAEAVPPS